MIIRSYTWNLVSLLIATAQAAQPAAPPPVSAPLRELPWGQLNFLHTTDTHGWHAGHLQEPSYTADWGDYVSFAQRLRERADDEGTDLLLIDTGDKVEGNGLYDASDPKGKYTLDIFKEQEIDVICSGNHELYKKSTSEDEYLKTVPNFHGNYLASNLDIFDPKTGDRVPLAPRYRKFTTKNQGIRIVAFGFLFDFTGNANNTVVEPVHKTIKQKWFQDAIHDREVDLFLVAGHVPLGSTEFNDIYKTIREVQWDTPIQFFGGHTHIRDYAKYDSKAYGLESGRYMETIGFMSIKGLSTGGKPKPRALGPEHLALRAAPKFSRRYIDNNLYSFHHHTSLNSTNFPTAHGRNVSATISSAREALDLGHKLGCAPADLWTNRAPYPSGSSIFSWLQEQVLPDTLSDPARKGVPRLVLVNTGALRFDVFKGPFTIDTTYSVSPFTSGFRFVKDVPLSVAKQLLKVLNQEIPQLFEIPPYELGAKLPVSSQHLQQQTLVQQQQQQQQRQPYELNHQFPLSSTVLKEEEDPDLTPGYTTTDAAGSDGDDTIHAPIKFYKVPNVIESRIAFPSSSSSSASEDKPPDPETVDLVYVDFIERYVLVALKFLGTDFAKADTEVFLGGKQMTEVIKDWVREHWKGDC
ncbi:MAG: hypothetical protein LQ351_004178 [Letrouitia transgressa]|nr:MAG: hypothetical protein LQ351_004178 [Letrouitia transgressa]